MVNVAKAKRITKEKSRSFSSGYLPVMLLVIFGQVMRVSLLIRKRNAQAFAAIDPTNAITILLVGLGALVLLTPRGNRVLRHLFVSPLRFFMIYFMFCGLSVLWSDDVAFTVFRTVQIVVNTVLMCWIMAEIGNLPDALLALIRFSAVWLIFGMLGKTRIAGAALFVNDNASACVAAMGFVMTIGAWKERIIASQKLALPAVVFIGGLVSCLSSASNISAILGSALVFAGVRNKNALLVQGLAGILVIVIGWSVSQSGVLNKWLMPGKTQQQIATLHGRTDMWKRYYKGIRERPVIGYGFPVGEKKARKLEDGTVFGTSSAHNSIIGVAINTGVVGLVLVFLGSLHILLATNASMIAGRQGGITIVSVLATAFLNSMSYPVVGSHWFWPTTVVMGIAGIGVCFVWRKKTERGRLLNRRRMQSRKVEA